MQFRRVSFTFLCMLILLCIRGIFLIYVKHMEIRFSLVATFFGAVLRVWIAEACLRARRNLNCIKKYI